MSGCRGSGPPREQDTLARSRGPEPMQPERKSPSRARSGKGETVDAAHVMLEADADKVYALGQSRRA